MKSLLSVIGIVIALASTTAYAIPTLFFDGTISYDASSGDIFVTSALVDTTDITPAPNLVGSSLSFSATLDSVDTSSPYYTAGLFTGVSGDDLSVFDGDLNTLLTGEFLSLQMKGGNGRTSGLITGLIDATGGDLESEFGTSNLIALQLNLTSSFSATMFDSDFSGNIDGRVVGKTPVPEPAVLTLVGLGLAFIGFMRLPSRAKDTTL